MLKSYDEGKDQKKKKREKIMGEEVEKRCDLKKKKKKFHIWGLKVSRKGSFLETS